MKPAFNKQLIKKQTEDHLSIAIFMTVLLVMGLVFGAIIVNSLPFDTKTNLLHYLNRFFTDLSEGKLTDQHAMFMDTLTHDLESIGLIWLLGLSIIGLPLVFVLVFIKGLVIGFTVGFLVNQMSLHGFWLALASVMPQNLILIPMFIIIGTASCGFCLRMIRQMFVKNSKAPILPALTRYVMLLLVLSAVVIAVSFFEAYVSPVLMQSLL